MTVRRLTFHIVLFSVLAVAFFSLGSYSARRAYRRDVTERDARIDALRAEMARVLASVSRRSDRPAATAGSVSRAETSDRAERSALVNEIKRELQDELGLLPVQVLRERSRCFVELYAYDNRGHSSYGTAGYLGNGYFITVKHGVQVLPKDPDADGGDPRRIVSVKLVFGGRTVPALVIDAGDADVEVHSGDWAILQVREKVDLPALTVNTAFPYDFADPIFRLGNDYSKGIILGTGYVGQRIANGLVTCLTDGHPGVSGCGVLNRHGQLVGIPTGRMQGDFRFSFILPVRREMFRKVPGVRNQPAEPAAVPAAQ